MSEEQKPNLSRVIREALAANDQSPVEMAKKRIAENRKHYAEPSKVFPYIASRWSQVLGCSVDAVDVATCMSELKAVRLAFNPEDLDSRVDQYGYLLIRDELLRAQAADIDYDI